MKGRPITRVEPMANGILRVTFDTGNSVTVDMKPPFGGFRFGVLQNPDIWQTADTDGGLFTGTKTACRWRSWPTTSS